MAEKFDWSEIDRLIEAGIALEYNDVIALYHLAGGKKLLDVKAAAPVAKPVVAAPAAAKPAAPAPIVTPKPGPVIPKSGA